MVQKNILTFTVPFLFCLVLFNCKKDTTLQDVSKSDLSYNLDLDLDPSKQISLPEFIDSIRMTKLISAEPILLKWFAGHIMKASKDYFFLKSATENAIYGIDKASYRVLWKINLESNGPNFPQSLFDFAIRNDREEIYIWDYQRSLFYVYNYAGKYVRNVIPENLPEKHYFDFYNSIGIDGIMFRLQGVPDYDDVYSESYENKNFVYYSYSDNRFSKLMTFPQGSPKRNSLMRRDFFPSLDGKLFYFYNYGHEIYQMKPDTIQSIIDLRSELFLDSAQLKKIDNMDRIKVREEDEEYIRKITKSKIFSIYGFIEKDNNFIIIVAGDPGIFYLMLSKDGVNYKFGKSKSSKTGFIELEGYGCFKKYGLHQMSDGRVYSITDGYHFNGSDLDCTDTRIINHTAGDPISDEDVFITEYFFRDEMEFDR